MSAYALDRTTTDVDLSDILPIHMTLRDGAQCNILQLAPSEVGLVGGEKSAPFVDAIERLLNAELERGTYPQRGPMNRQQVLDYYFSHAVFCAVDARDRRFLGAFYIKPNFPGRCSHICNSGFLVAETERSRGVGRSLATAMERLAPALGYRAAFFNLVFVDNPTSIRLWRSLDYEEVGRVPDAKFNDDGSGVDALMLYKRFR